ncbi:MAG: bifunctional folylpolyglutamate synthase/dihydrofolate synthase [bacterium]
MKNDFLEKLYSRKGGIKLGIGRVAEAFPLILEKKIPVYHVGGTNGKGTTVYAISHILEKNGFKTGRFISPHLFDFNERVAVNGVNISDEKVKELYSYLEKKIDNFEILSFFEVTFLMAWKHFENENCDRVVIEVGLGGRLDATNVINWQKTDIITSIQFDHTHILGDTIEKIAFEKLGIVKKGDLVVVREKESWLEKEAVSRGASVVVNENFCSNIVINRSDLSKEQIKNIKLAASAVKLNELEVIFPDFSEMTLPGRYELIEEGIRIDVAHNPPAIKALVTHIVASKEKVVVLYGAMKDKDIPSVLEELSTVAISIFVVTVDEMNRGATAEEVLLKVPIHLQQIVKKNKNDFLTMQEAIDFAKEKGVTLLVTGSFYTVEKFVKWKNVLKCYRQEQKVI